MNNKAAIHHAVKLAQAAAHMATYYTREHRFYPSAGMDTKARAWLDRRAHHMATARQLKQDAQQ